MNMKNLIHHGGHGDTAKSCAFAFDFRRVAVSAVVQMGLSP